MSSNGVPGQRLWRLAAFISPVWVPVFFLTWGDIFPIFSKKQRLIMTVVLMCFVCLFLFAYTACLYLAVINSHIQRVNLKKIVFAYLGGAMPCLVAHHPQTPGA
jgi:hypothetical protein